MEWFELSLIRACFAAFLCFGETEVRRLIARKLTLTVRGLIVRCKISIGLLSNFKTKLKRESIMASDLS